MHIHSWTWLQQQDQRPRAYYVDPQVMMAQLDEAGHLVWSMKEHIKKKKNNGSCLHRAGKHEHELVEILVMQVMSDGSRMPNIHSLLYIRFLMLIHVVQMNIY